MEKLNDRDAPTESGSGDTLAPPEWLLQHWFSLQRESDRARTTWRTTVLQVQAVFLSLCLPLSLADKPQGTSLRLLHLTALFCILALISGTISLIAESTRARLRESQVLQRIRERETSVSMREPRCDAGNYATPLFVLTSVASLVCLYLSMLFRT